MKRIRVCDKIMEILSKLNPIQILKNGYAFVEKDNNKLLSVSGVDVGDVINVSLSDGRLSAKVLDKENKDDI